MVSEAQKRAIAKYRAKNREALAIKNRAYLKNRYLTCPAYKARQDSPKPEMLEQQILRCIRKLYL